MDYYQAYMKDEMIAAKARNLFHAGGNAWSFPDTGNTFSVFAASPYSDSVAFAPDVPTFCECAAHYGTDAGTDFEQTRGRTIWNGRGVVIIGVFDGRASTLVHETGHATLRILERAGLITRVSNDEAFCYLQTAMFDAFEGAI